MKKFKRIFIADVYENLNGKEYLAMKNAILYKTEFEDLYRIVNLSEYDIQISDKTIIYPNNKKIIDSYYVKEMKDFIYMNGKEIEKVMKYVK